MFLRRRSRRPVAVAAQSSDQDVLGDPVELTGTTTFAKTDLQMLFAAHHLPAGGLLQLHGQLVAEPDNPADPNAIAVHVEGARAGYLPGYLAERAFDRVHLVECRTQLWGVSTANGLRVRGWVALGTGPVWWPHSPHNPPAVTIADRRAERVADVSAMVNDAIVGGGPRAAQFKQGMVGKYHYLETVEPIKQLKRQGHLGEALKLCYGSITAAEDDRQGREPAPWYTEQAAIIHRKRHEQDKEEAVLRRWLQH